MGEERPAVVEERRSGERGRRILPARGLPGGRAVVGALLVTAAAVAVFAAYLDATAEPSGSYVVATGTVEPGTRLATIDDVAAVFGTVALDLASPVADQVIPSSAIDDLVGRVVVAPLEPGDLLTRTQLIDDGGVQGAQTLSFALPRTAAVAGSLRPGERIDVLATYGSGDGSYTTYVVRGIPLLRLTAPDGGTLGGSSELTLTVAVSSLEDVQALGHAVNTADVFVTRSTATPDQRDPAPGAYRASPSEVGPLPDPATPTGPVTAPDASATPQDAQDEPGEAAGGASDDDADGASDDDADGASDDDADGASGDDADGASGDDADGASGDDEDG